jgi:ArsR family metal-binding transcriptional regulator
MKELPLVKEKDGVRYILAGDRYLPDVIKPAGKMIVGKFISTRARFLLNHRRDIFLQLQEEGKLLEHLERIDDEAEEMIHNIMKQMLEAEPIPESLKNTDTLQWVGLMNNYRSSAEEIVFHDLIYREGLLEELEDMELPVIDPEKVFRKLTPEELEAEKGIT